MVMVTDQIVQLVAAGGGMRIIARGKTCDQLVIIASAGKGGVFFDDEF